MKERYTVANRFLIGLYAVLGLVVTCFAVCAIVALDNLSVGQKILAILAALVIVVWSLRILQLALPRRRKANPDSVAVQNTQDGDVRISVDAMDTMVRQAIGEEAGVTDLNSSVINNEDSVSVVIHMTIDGNVNIPNTSMLMQRRIKTTVEEYTGVAVRDVRVTVDNVNPVPLPTPQGRGPVIQPAPEILPEPETMSAEEESPEASGSETAQAEESGSGAPCEDDFSAEEPIGDVSLPEDAAEEETGAEEAFGAWETDASEDVADV